MLTSKGKIHALQLYVGAVTALGPRRVRLLIADISGDWFTHAWNASEEASFAGYGYIPIAGWAAGAINISNWAEILSPTLTFTAGAIVGTQTIYSLVVTVDVPGGVDIIDYIPFHPLLVMTAPGDTIERKLDLGGENFAF